MKLFNKYMLVALLGGIALTSCSDDDDYSAGPQNEGEAVSFGTISASESVTYRPADATSISFTAYRADGTAAVDVPLTVVENENDRFVIPSSIHFNAGETETEIEISFPDIELGETAAFEIAIADGYQNLYATNTLRRDITRDYNWINYVCAVTDGWTKMEDSEVVIQHADGYNIWRLVDFFAEYCVTNEYEYDYNLFAQYITFTVNEDGTVIFDAFKADTYDGTAATQIYGYYPGSLSTSNADLQAELDAAKAACKALDSYTVSIVPAYNAPNVGYFGTKPMTITLDKGQGEAAVFGDFGELPADAE